MAYNLARQAEMSRWVLALRGAKESIGGYVEYLDLGFRPAAHHLKLLSGLEGVERGRIPKLMVFQPPRTGKSTYSSWILPSWYLGRHPERSVIACSHTDELAEDFGRRVRNLYTSAAHYRVFGVGVASGSHAAGRWETEKGGRYFAAGVGGSVTGRGGDLGLVDDPVKSREDADSEVRRRRVWEWYNDDFLTRLQPGAGQILVMTRWHEDDLAGRLLEREGASWERIEFPMEALPGDPLGRSVGDRLWPEWTTPEQVAAAKMNTRTWNALYQQNPVGESGDYFKLAWFQEYEKLPGSIAVYGASDYAVTDGGGDYTEHGIFAVDAWSNLYVLDWWRGQTGTAEWIERQCDLVQQWKPVCWFAERGVIERSVGPYLRQRLDERRCWVRIEGLSSVHNKTVRCRSFQALAENGKVHFPVVAPWKADVVGSLTRFPAGKYDDSVDVCSLIGRGLEVVAPPRLSREPAPERPRPMPSDVGSPTGWMGV